MALSEKHRAVADEYLRCFNRRQAYRAAYPDTSDTVASSNSWRLWQNPEMQEYISKRLTETAMSADEVLMRLAEQARGDIGDYLTTAPNGTDVVVDLPKAIDANKTRLIKKLTQKRTTRTRDDVVEEDVVTSIEMYDAQAALGLIGKKHGLFVDRSELTGKDGGPIETTDATFTDEQRAARIAAIFEAARARRDRQATEGGSDNMAPTAGSTD